MAIDSQQVHQHHFQAHLRQSLRPVICAQYRKAEQEQRRPDYTAELAHAQREWIKNRQQVSYHKEISSMLSKSTPRKPLVRQLLLFLDDTGVIRFGKRVHNAPVSKSTKLLLFPPPKDSFTELDMRDTYFNPLYACASSTLNLVRLRYWIPAGRQHVKKAINHCVTCKTIIGLPCNIPDPSLLPKKRLTQAEKFTVTDVDFTRALYIREAVAQKKDYICFFTCATTRVVHLVVVTDLSIQTFALA